MYVQFLINKEIKQKNPCNVVSAGTLNSFQNLDDKHWNHLLFCTDVADKHKPGQ